MTPEWPRYFLDKKIAETTPARKARIKATWTIQRFREIEPPRRPNSDRTATSTNPRRAFRTWDAPSSAPYATVQLRTIGDYPELPLIIILSKDFLQTINNFRPNRVCSKEKVELAAHYLTHFHPTPENVCVQRERHASKVSQPERRSIGINLATKCRVRQRDDEKTPRI